MGTAKLERRRGGGEVEREKREREGRRKVQGRGKEGGSEGREERRKEGGKKKRGREEGGQVTLYSYMLVTRGLTSFIVWRSMGNLMTL